MRNCVNKSIHVYVFMSSVMQGSVSGEESTTSKKGQKRKASRAASPSGEKKHTLEDLILNWLQCFLLVISLHRSANRGWETTNLTAEEYYLDITIYSLCGNLQGSVQQLEGKGTVNLSSKLKRFSSFSLELSHLDSQPGTPVSVESANSEASKLRLKIKVCS